MSLLVWTTKSTRHLAQALGALGHQHADRDAQFAYLAAQAGEHTAAGEPVISVDAKKKELVGDFKNGGREYQLVGSPERVNVHDFPDKELGKAIPYGVYDVSANTGWVSVGTDHDTSAFAVATLRTWWDTVGHARCPQATRLLICADGGGSNGHRIRAWKVELAAFAADTGLRALHLTGVDLDRGCTSRRARLSAIGGRVPVVVRHGRGLPGLPGVAALA